MNFLRRARFAPLLAVLLASATGAQEPQATPTPKPEGEMKTGDARAQAALDKLKYKHTVNKNRAFELTFELKNNRSQLVFVNSVTETFGKLELRDVTSTAYKVKGKLPAEDALRLLADNDKRKWGAWRSVEESGFTYVVYAVQVPADADADTLDNAIEAAMLTADEMEKQVTGADDF